MKLFDLLFSAEKRETKLLEKDSRAVAIVASYTEPDVTVDEVDVSDPVTSTPPNFGIVVFKYKRNDKWVQRKVILREDVGHIEEGDQWIVKFNESYTGILAVHIPLSPNSPYRLVEADVDSDSDIEAKNETEVKAETEAETE